jgi:hypothetical protein
MDPTDGTGKAPTPEQATAIEDDATATASGAASDRPFGPDAAAILATEHWSLLGTRSMNASSPRSSRLAPRRPP